MPESLSLQTLVPYLVEHNTSIVSTLVLLIILLSMFLGFRSFLSAKNADKFQGAEPSMAHLEETLKKLLERADQVPSAAAAGGAGASAENTALLKEIEDLKNSLAEKQVQMEMLERQGSEPAAGAAAGAGLSNAEKDAMNSQIKDLQARLSEYEIISEDIADLSFFREENAKLQKELETLKKGGAAPAPVAAAATDPAPVAESAVAPVAEAPTSAVATPEAAAAVVAAETPPSAKEVAAQAPLAGDNEVDVGQELVDKLLAQHQAPAEPSAIGNSGDLDVEKMVAEAAALQTAPTEEKNALEDSLDSDKLLAEAAGMEGKINPEDAKLMGEFEDFMKKGGVG